MPVNFNHLGHVATVWLPELAPTSATSASTLVAVAICALLMGAIAMMFAGMCMENASPMRYGIGSVVAILALVAIVPGMRHRIFDASPIASADTYVQRADATTAAQQAAQPAGAWRAVTKAVKAPSSTSRVTWSADDLRALSRAVERKAGVTAPFSDTEATIDTSGMATETIAKSGTSYLSAHHEHVRCVAELADIKQNNVGQPLSATLSQVKCAPAPVR